MKHLIDIFLITFSLISITGCSAQIQTSPSKNSALNSISKSNASSEKGFLQKNLDSFLENEWETTLKQDKNIQEKYKEQEERSFTLQEYVDKATAYKKAHPSDHEHSNVHKLENMPIIGKSKSR